MRSLHPLCVLLMTCLMLVGCHDGSTNTSGDATAVAAMQQSIALVRAGRLADFARQALPPADYANLRADWRNHPASVQPFSNDVRKHANSMLDALNPPDAQARLDATLLPKLAAAQYKFGDQVMVMVGVGQALLDKRIDASPALNKGQKQLIKDVFAALAPWARQAPWFDPDRARDAIALSVTRTQALELTHIEQLQGLDFDAAMGKYAKLQLGLEKLLNIYGLSVDDALASVKVTLLPAASNNKHRARLRIHCTLAGKPLSTEAVMIERSGRWYSQTLLQAARTLHARMKSSSATAHR